MYSVGFAVVTNSIEQPAWVKYFMYLPTCRDSGSLFGGAAIDTKRILSMSIVKLIYNQLRYSEFFPFYLKIFRPQIYVGYLKELNFYKAILPSPTLVFDVGANVGDKTALFASLGHNVVAVEPDRENFRLLKRRFARTKSINIEGVAVGDSPDTRLFYVNEGGSPANTLSVKWKKILEDASMNRWAKALPFAESYAVAVITLDQLIRSFGKPFYIKIDVEGYEEHVFKGLTTAVNVISFEANFPEFRHETVACVSIFNQLVERSAFNAVNQDFSFFFSDHLDFNAMIEWLTKTDLKYFEVFCFKIA